MIKKVQVLREVRFYFTDGDIEPHCQQLFEEQFVEEGHVVTSRPVLASCSTAEALDKIKRIRERKPIVEEDAGVPNVE